MFIFYLFAAILVFLSYKSFRGGIDYLNFFKREISKPKSDFTPFVSVIVPCRGLDEDLEKNLDALFEQDFPAYEILFVVDDAGDAAVSVINKLFQRGDAGKQRNKSSKSVIDEESDLQNSAFLHLRVEISAKLVVAGKAEGESQKVHNLREAVLNVSDESEAFVFVDSDARPNKEWLRNLIAPLQDETTGAATGYRWFISKKINFASEMRSVWNASIASALGANLKSNFCWGGSTAIGRETFEKLEIREKWRGVLSDDFAVTLALKKAGLPIRFVPQALTASVENCSLKELLEFTTRQMKITRVYAPRLWKASFTGSFLFNLVFVWGILIIALNPINTLAFWFALASLILISAFSAGKAWLRLSAVKLVLKEYEKDLNRQFRTQNTLWIFSPALFLYNSVAALFSRKILWRGIVYELKSPDETIIIQPDTTSF